MKSTRFWKMIRKSICSKMKFWCKKSTDFHHKFLIRSKRFWIRFQKFPTLIKINNNKNWWSQFLINKSSNWKEMWQKMLKLSTKKIDKVKSRSISSARSATINTQKDGKPKSTLTFAAEKVENKSDFWKIPLWVVWFANKL